MKPHFYLQKSVPPLDQPMKIVLACIFASVIALLGVQLSSCHSQKDFISRKDRITEIIIRLPGMHGDIKSDVIKPIANHDEISALVEFANRHTNDSSSWMDVDSALSPLALVNLRFMDGAEWKGTFGFSADFQNGPANIDSYGIGQTYFEVFDSNGHRKKNVSLRDVEEVLRLTGFSKNDYLTFQKIWLQGLQWPPK
jgi:hypothetical protein